MNPPEDFVLCMSADERKDWDKFNKRTWREHGSSPCWDCTPAFAAEMTKLYRCNGTPVANLRVCLRCAEKWPATDEFWEIRARPVGTRLSSRERSYTTRTATLTYVCRACRRERQAANARKQETRDRLRLAHASARADPVRRALERERWRVRMADPDQRQAKQRADRERWARAQAKARAKPCPVSLPAGGQMKEKT